MSQRTPAVGDPDVTVQVPEAAATDAASQPQNLPVPAAFLGLLGVYLLGVGSVLFAPEGSDVAVWWPAAGLGVAMLLLAPRRMQWALALGIVAASGLANFTGGRAPAAALGFGLSNGAEAFVVAWLLTRGKEGRPPLRTMEDLWRLAYSTLAGNLVVAVGIGLTVVYGLDGSFTGAATAVVASHAAAILIIVPLAMRAGPSTLAGREWEAVAQWVLLLAAVGYVFSPEQTLSLTFLPLPLLLWAALRFGVRTVSYQLLAIGVVTTTLTAAGGGPFAPGTRTGITATVTTASLVQAFLLVTALIALPLAVAVDQRRTALITMSQREELFRKSFSESFVGMLMLYLSRDGLRIRELNQTASDILARTSEELEDHLLQPLLETNTSLKDVARQLLDGDLSGWREETWLTTEPGRRVGFALSPMSTSADEPMFSAQLMDLTDVHFATARLQTEKDFTSAVLDTTACLIVVVDVDGRVTGLNPAGERASGRTEKEVLDRPLWETLVPATDARHLRDMLDRTRPGRETPTFEGDLLSTTENGRRRIVWSSAPLTNESGRRTHVVLTGIDVTEERNVRSMTNHLLDSATSTAFIGLNLRGTITIFNAGAQELLGYTASEVTGRLRLESLHDPHEVASLAAELGTPPGFPTIVAGVEEAPQTRDWTYLRQDGSRVACAITLSAVRDAFGSHIGYLAVGRDVTESRRNQKILVETLAKEREAVERLRDLDRAKSDFVSMVSHELRTPMTSIVGYTEMLQDGAGGPVSKEQRRLLEAVRRNGERLVALIEDLLTLSRIESGTFTLEKAPVDLRKAFERAHESLEPMLVGRKLDVHFELPDHPVQVLGDARQLERMIVNLLGNAVKFTDDGGRIAWSLSTTSDQAIFRVADTGIGIPESEQPSLFTRFFRSSTARDRAIQGTGLGLTIVQSIVQSHGGQITIRSREHVGTDVEVVLPLNRSSIRLDAGP